jgi:hypothetical protein
MISAEIADYARNDPRSAAIIKRFGHIEFPGHEQAKLLYAAVFNTDFEFYSHFVGRFDCQFQKSPELFFEGMLEGFGGHCIEKNLALKYLFHEAGFDEVDCVFGGSIRGSNRPFDSRKADEVGIGSWVSGFALPQILHCSIMLKVRGKQYIFDPNNGRMGPIITTAEETEHLLRDHDKAFYEMYNGKMYYQRVPHRYHERVLTVNRGDEVFGLMMAERLGVMARDNFDIIVTTIDNGEDAMYRWNLTPYLRDVVIVGEDFRFLEGQEGTLPIDQKLALYLQEARRRINEIGKRADGYTRYLAIRIFKKTWWEMSRLSTWAPQPLA